MQMEFDNGVLSLENAQGRKWQLHNTEKPRLSFVYDALSVTQRHALRRLEGRVQPLTKKEVEEVTAFVASQSPPFPHAHFAVDLKTLACGLINTAVAQLKFGNLLDVQIAAREGSTDLRAEISRQTLAYVDAVWNSYHGLVSSIDATPEDELMSLTEYASMMPMLPNPGELRNVKKTDLPVTDAPLASLPCALNGSDNGQRPHDLPIAPAGSAGRPVTLETCAPQDADFSTIVDQAFVFDNFFPLSQLQLYEKWAMRSPHWMLSNSSHDEDGQAKHRIWGASFIEAWRRKGWTGLPPVLFTIVATLLQKLDITITDPEYIGLNGQSKDQTASMHTDCAHDSPNDISILVYFGEDTDGDLLLYDKADTKRLLHRIAFAPNRVVVFDGSIPHQALAPTDNKFRMSMIIRGKYKTGATDLIGLRREA
jgi:hypothetical protein